VEVSGDAGLMYATGKGLRVVKKAPLRQIEIPDSIFRYVLMTRVKVTRSTYYDEIDTDKRKFFKQWLEEKEVDHLLGLQISQSLRRRVDEEVLKAREENERLETKIATYSRLKEFLIAMGLDLDKSSIWRVEQVIKQKTTRVPDGMQSRITELLQLMLELDEFCSEKDQSR
jgi:hypothetical protein